VRQDEARAAVSQKLAMAEYMLGVLDKAYTDAAAGRDVDITTLPDLSSLANAYGAPGHGHTTPHTDLLGRGTSLPSDLFTAQRASDLLGRGTSLPSDLLGRGTSLPSDLTSAQRASDLLGRGTLLHTGFTTAPRASDLLSRGTLLHTGLTTAPRASDLLSRGTLLPNGLTTAHRGTDLFGHNKPIGFNIPPFADGAGLAPPTRIVDDDFDIERAQRMITDLRGMGMHSMAANLEFDVAQAQRRRQQPSTALDAAMTRQLLGKATVPTPEKYDGKRAPDSWLFTCETCYVLNGADRSVWAMLASGLLTGPAEAIWKQTASPMRDDTWQDFCDCMRTWFGVVQTDEQARVALDRLQMRDSVTGYTREFNKLVSQITRMPPAEGDLIYLYTKGLSPALRAHVLCRPDGMPWTSYADLVRFAIMKEAQLGMLTPGRVQAHADTERLPRHAPSRPATRAPYQPDVRIARPDRPLAHPAPRTRTAFVAEREGHGMAPRFGMQMQGNYATAAKRAKPSAPPGSYTDREKHMRGCNICGGNHHFHDICEDALCAVCGQKGHATAAHADHVAGRLEARRQGCREARAAAARR
jgi:hypothetical protein